MADLIRFGVGRNLVIKPESPISKDFKHTPRVITCKTCGAQESSPKTAMQKNCNRCVEERTRRRILGIT